MRTRLYRDGALAAADFPPAEVSDHLAQPASVVWLDLCNPSADDLDLVADELDLHDLAIEDALTARQRPKLDHYGGHLFLNAYAAHLNSATGELTTSEVSAFVTSQALVTVRKDDGFDMSAVLARWDESPELARYGIGFLLYGLLDFVIDGHFQVVESLDEEIEGLEDLLFDPRPRSTEVQRRSFELRKSLVVLRRIVLPMREVVNALMRRDLHVVSEPMMPYYQDVYDHVLRATEWTESLRDLVTTILETHLTIQGNRLNEIMKKLTAWAAIIAVPTAVTGYFGQNVPYPGFGKPWGVVLSLGIIVGMAAVLYAAFRRREWL